MNVDLASIIATIVGTLITGVFYLVGVYLKHRLENPKDDYEIKYYDVTDAVLGKDREPNLQAFSFYPLSMFKPRSYRRWYLLSFIVALCFAVFIYARWYHS